jgi:transposase InsO family protein
MPGASSAGGSAAPPMRASFLIPWSRPSTTADLCGRAALFIIATGACRGRAVRVDQVHRAAGGGRHRPSVGGIGDSYDNALAEAIMGLYKTEVMRRRGPWCSLETVEFATLAWVDWFNHRRLLEPIGNIPPPRRRRPIMPSSRRSPWRRDSNQMASNFPDTVHRFNR